MIRTAAPDTAATRIVRVMLPTLTPLSRPEAADSCEVVRTAPGKPDRTVDVTRYCSSIEHEPGLLRMLLRMTEAGTARPDEIAQAVAGLEGRTATIKRLVRTRIDLRPQPVGART